MSLHLYVVECYINMSSYGKNGHYEAISFIWAIKHNGMGICIIHISMVISNALPLWRIYR